METRRETAAEWVARWRALGSVLERERTAEFAAAGIAAISAAFDGLLQVSLRTHPPSPDNGLIEQQRLVQRIRHA